MMDAADTPTAPFRDAPGGSTALLIIDMIGETDFSGSDALLADINGCVTAIERLRDEATRAGAPVIYVNDNFGEWHSERSRLFARATAEGSAGRDVALRLAPRDDDYFIIKPQFSGFYATNLPVLLPKLGVTRLILAGIAADICVLFTAADAHMRDYRLWVPADAVASQSPARRDTALEIMRGGLHAETRPTDALTLAEWAGDA